MGKFSLTHDIQVSAADVWALLLDRSFAERTFGEIYRQYTVTEQSDSGQTVIRKAILEPAADFPGPLAKVLGSGYREAEESNFDTPQSLWSWKRVPSTLSDKVRMEGVVRIEEAGGGHSRMVTEIDIEARIFGIGGLFESTFEKRYREDWDKLAIALNKG
ncbi:hypothetical protein A8W25_24800 [Streptomyces sp. ERV7]|uniref:DUF2505 family protein n=1 Tax=Streptomyces sp. ERV7 TaxID=1322334 RepID=UPI0007F498C5|nr:DUF2505 family protein [Streptomyces sp. ERV7]OAR22795.1 hypothetical protein A8W25_24800 [Streptomyces sp. ERV7]